MNEELDEKLADSKRLVPLVIDRIMTRHECSRGDAYAIFFNQWLKALELVITKDALAFCRAIKKLVTGG